MGPIILNGAVKQKETHQKKTWRRFRSQNAVAQFEQALVRKNCAIFVD